MKNDTIDTLTDIIRSRRSIFPNMYSDKPISDEVIMEILENANWAPTHKKTEPWRFIVLKGQKQKELGIFLSDFYKKNTPEDKFNEKKYEKMKRKTSLGGAMIIINMKRDPKEQIEEWEEMAAVSMAVQNMWLTCHTHQIGAYWGTPAARKGMSEFVEMEEGEVCLGLFFMGYLKDEDLKIPSTRGPIEDKIKWYK